MRGATLATCLLGALAGLAVAEDMAISSLKGTSIIRRDSAITPAPAPPSSFAAAVAADIAPCLCEGAGVQPAPTPAPVLQERQIDNPEEAINAASRSAQQEVARASQSVAEERRQARESIRQAEESARQAVAQASRDSTEAARQARESADRVIGEASRSADTRVRQADESARRAAQEARESARAEIDRSVSLVQAARADATAVREEANVQVTDAQSSALSTTQTALAVTAAVAGTSILSIVGFWLVVRYRRKKARQQEEEAARSAQEARKSFAASSVYSQQTEWKQPGSVAGDLNSWLRQTREDTSVYGGARAGPSPDRRTERSANWPLRLSRASSVARR